MFQQVRDRRLAVCSRHADNRHRAVRKSIVALGHPSKRRARIRYLDKGYFRLGVKRQLVRDDRHGSAVDGLVDKTRPVRAQSRESKKQVARHYATAVHHKTRNRSVETAFAGYDLFVAKIIGKFGRHFEYALVNSTPDSTLAKRLDPKCVNKRIILV